MDLPENIKAQLADLQRRIQTGCRFVDAHPRWVPASNFHLTVEFFGNTPEEYIDGVQKLLDTSTQNVEPFTLELNRVELFPPESRQPKVISVAVGGQKRELVRLHEEIFYRFVGAGYPLEQREYRPHLTIARLPSTKTAARVESIVRSHSKIMNSAFSVNEIILFESVPGLDGVEYKKLHASPLGR